MKKYTIMALMKHEVSASPREIIENYVDYGHEVYAHGKYSSSKKKDISKITKVSFRVLSVDEREVVIPLNFLRGLIKEVLATTEKELIIYPNLKSADKAVFVAII